MLLKVIMRQTKFLLGQREAVLAVLLLMWLVIYNYVGNVLGFQGTDVSQMYQSMKLLCLSYNRVNYNAGTTLLLTMLYPVLVALPAGFSYAKEQQTKEEVFLIARIGKRNYLLGRLWAAFFTTALVFSFPFLLEILMNCLSFPLKAQKDLSNLGLYNSDYAQMVHRYLGEELYMLSPVLYAMAGTLFFGMISGILGMFTAAFSFAISVKYRVLLLLPAFLFLNGTSWLNMVVGTGGARTNWYEYLLLFDDSQKNVWYLVIGVGFLLVLTAAFSIAGMKREKWE